MNNCWICGKTYANIVCDNSCGATFCSDVCLKKDTHECSGSGCIQCYGSVIMQPNGLWKCYKCSFQSKKLIHKKLMDYFDQSSEEENLGKETV